MNTTGVVAARNLQLRSAEAGAVSPFSALYGINPATKKKRRPLPGGIRITERGKANAKKLSTRLSAKIPWIINEVLLGGLSDHDKRDRLLVLLNHYTPHGEVVPLQALADDVGPTEAKRLAQKWSEEGMIEMVPSAQTKPRVTIERKQTTGKTNITTIPHWQKQERPLTKHVYADRQKTRMTRRHRKGWKRIH